MNNVQHFYGRTGRKIANQCVMHYVEDGVQVERFYSYNTLVCEKRYTPQGLRVLLSERYWNYSATTAKYRREFLCEGVDATRQRIEDGVYTLVDAPRNASSLYALAPTS